MASANVTLREGKSYTYTDGPNTYRFSQMVTPVVGEELIQKLEQLPMLCVERNQDKPVTPLMAKKPAGKPVKAVKQPEPEPEPEPEEETEPEEQDEPAEDGEVLPDDGDPEEQVADETTEPEAEEEPAPTPAPKAQAKGGKPAGKGGKK